MASINKISDEAVVVYVSLGHDTKGKRIRKSKKFFKPSNMTAKRWEKEIQKLAVEFEQELNINYSLNAQITLKDYSKKWLSEYGNINLEDTTLDSYKRELRTKILPALGHLKIGSITPIHIVSFLNNLLEDGVRVDGKPGSYSDKTIKYQWQILSSLLQQAVYWQILENNPCKSVKVPKNKKDMSDYTEKVVEFYDEDQAILLIDIINNEVANHRIALESYKSGSKAYNNLNHSNPLKYKTALYIALFSGLRNGEILGLTWNDIDFVNKTLSVKRVRAVTKEHGMITKYPKSKSSVRTLSLPDSVLDVLLEHKEEQDRERDILLNLWDKEWDNTPWIFTQWNGKGMYYQTLSKWLKKVVRKHNKAIMEDENIPDKKKINYLLPVLSIHKLRHTSATLLIGQNTDIRTVSARLGHAQTSTTMDIYVHGLKSIDRKASDTLEELLDKNKRKLRVVK